MYLVYHMSIIQIQRNRTLVMGLAQTLILLLPLAFQLFVSFGFLNQVNWPTLLIINITYNYTKLNCLESYIMWTHNMCSTRHVWSSDTMTAYYNNAGQLVSCVCVPLTMRQNSNFLCDSIILIFATQDNRSTHFLETGFSIYINHWFWKTSLPIKTQKTEVIFQALPSYVLIFRSFFLFVLYTKILLYIHSWKLITHLGTYITVENHGI